MPASICSATRVLQYEVYWP